MSASSESLSGEDRVKPRLDPIQSVLDALGRLRFGAIQLTVHEGKLVQVDVTERQRFTN